jgi:hypothetical protein
LAAPAVPVLPAPVIHGAVTRSARRGASQQVRVLAQFALKQRPADVLIL